MIWDAIGIETIQKPLVQILLDVRVPFGFHTLFVTDDEVDLEPIIKNMTENIESINPIEIP